MTSIRNIITIKTSECNRLHAFTYIDSDYICYNVPVTNIKFQKEIKMGNKIGFIGIGVIASAMVEGFCMKDDLEHEIYLSPRNITNATNLSEKNMNVHVCRSNQEVLNKSDWVILSVLPKLGEEIIRPLRFKESHNVINVMSDHKLPEIQDWIGKTRSLVHVVPLSFIARRSGPIAIYPVNNEVVELFSPLGEVIAVDDVSKMETITAITGLMTSYYALLHNVVKWGETEGLTKEEATNFTSSFFEALSKHARYGDLTSLATEMTPGGLNEMALHDIEGQGGFDIWIKALAPIMNRLKNPNY